jgi:urea transport system ATP-binding protein
MLEIKNLYSGYTEDTVLEGFSAQIPKRRTTALMGRNGMGKTTLLKNIMGLLPVRSGAIFWNDTELSNLETYQISNSGVGYVPQGREVFDDFTVFENLKLAALGSDKINMQMLPRIYNWFPILKERARQKAGTFSGGQQQILAIARALMTNPDILLLDEPTEGIQPNIVQEIGRKLKQIASETGLGILLVEQNVDMVKTMADHVIFMENGVNKAETDMSSLLRDDHLIHNYLSI